MERVTAACGKAVVGERGGKQPRETPHTGRIEEEAKGMGRSGQFCRPWGGTNFEFPFDPHNQIHGMGVRQLCKSGEI